MGKKKLKPYIPKNAITKDTPWKVLCDKFPDLEYTTYTLVYRVEGMLHSVSHSFDWYTLSKMELNVLADVICDVFASAIPSEHLLFVSDAFDYIHETITGDKGL